MTTGLYKKGMVLGIICLFIGAGVLPITGAIKNFEKVNIVLNSTSMDTITVDDEEDGDYASIQEAIDDASPGDTIKVYSGTYIENVVVDKQLTIMGIDEELGIGDDVGKPIIDGGSGKEVVLIYADSVNISGFTIQNGTCGIWMEYSNNSTITGNNISNNNGHGIAMYASNNTITRNNISNNNGHGIAMYASNNTITRNNISNNYAGILIVSSNNTITRNNIANNFFGIYIDGSSNNTITGNNILSNLDGIYIKVSSNNTITGNNILSNNLLGIRIGGSSNNTITGNNISGSDYSISINMYIASINRYSSNNTITGNNISGSDYGISIGIYCNKNILYLNNFIENNVNAWDAGTNQWDNGSVGNYWDDYEGLDDDGDGIGDTPYKIKGGFNKDRYPLFVVWDTTAPSCNITVPVEGYLHILNIPTRIKTGTIIIGFINIRVSANDVGGSGMDSVEFYIDNVLKHFTAEIPYNWLCTDRMLGTHTLKAIAVDNAGNKGESQEITALWCILL